MQTICLIALEVRYRRNLKPTFLGCAPYLEVVADSRGETHIATAKTQDVVGEFELLKQALYMVEHLVERLI